MCGGAFERLAGGAPEGGAGVEALLARFDGGATAAARFATPRVNPEIFFAVGAAGSATRATVRDDLIAGSAGDIGEQKFACGGNEAGKFSDAERGYGAEGMYETGKADFGFEDIADAGEQRLGEERFAYGGIGTAAETLQDFGVVIFGGEDGRSDLVEDATAAQRIGGVKFGDGYLEGDSVDFFGANDDAHVVATAVPFFAGAVDVPTAAHEHVGEKN